MTPSDRLPEIRGLPQHGDMAINCGPAIVKTNEIWITIRHGGQNKTIMVSQVGAIQFAQQLLRVADELD